MIIRIATFTTLFPNAADPAHGVFVEERLRHLVASGEVEARVVAPVPWFPFQGRRFGKYGRFARAPRVESRHGIEVRHPRYFLPPAVGMNLAPYSLALAALRELRRLRAEGFAFDAIDAHYLYPDGVAAAWLARELGVPFVVTARGSDVTLLPRFKWPRKLIRAAAKRAAAIITVCEALKHELNALGIDSARVRTLRNGVDLDKFRPADRVAARRASGIGGRTVLSVGLLIGRKRHDLSVRALTRLPEVRLCIVGQGPEEKTLRRLARECGVEERVTFAGAVPHERLRDYYSAADALLLCSEREGMANVLLESIACGTRVAATDVHGAREVISAPEAGLLIPDHTVSSVAGVLRRLLDSPPDRAATRRHAEKFSWETTSRGQLDVLRGVLGRSAA